MNSFSKIDKSVQVKMENFRSFEYKKNHSKRVVFYYSFSKD